MLSFRANHLWKRAEYVDAWSFVLFQFNYAHIDEIGYHYGVSFTLFNFWFEWCWGRPQQTFQSPDESTP